MPLNNTDINILLAKCFAKEPLSPNEREQLHNWKEENHEEYLRLKKLIDINSTTTVYDTDKAWQKVLSKKQNNSLRTNSFSFLRNNFIAYGLVASLFILLGTWAWFYQNKTTYQEYSNSDMLTKLYTLPDNSTVTLNYNTRLRYYKSKEVRKTELLSGEAFFEVEPNKQKPFIIITENAKVQVLGTSFNVNTSDNKTQVSVKTGTVSLSNDNNKNIVLNKGEQGVATSNSLTKSELKNDNYLAWKTRKLTFKNSSLYEATKELEAYYHVKIKTSENCRNCFFTTTFTTESIDEAMKEIQMLTHIEYKIKDNIIFVSCINCK